MRGQVEVKASAQVEIKAPAQVVRGKVIVDIEDDIPVPMFALTEKEYPRMPPPEKDMMHRPVSSELEGNDAQTSELRAGTYNQALASSPSAKVPPPPALVAMRGRSAQRDAIHAV